MPFLLRSTFQCRGGGLILQPPNFSAYPTPSWRPRLHFKKRKEVSFEWVVKRNSFRLNNSTTRVGLRKCLLRVYAMADGAGDFGSFDNVEDVVEGSASGSEEEANEEIVDTVEHAIEFIHEDATYLEDKLKGRSSLNQTKATFDEARFLLGLLITAELSFVIIGLLLFVDWYIRWTFRVPLPYFLLTFPFLAAAMITGVLGVICVPLLKKLKLKQIFRKEGPMSHLVKMGTPTMGGLYFIPVGLLVARSWTGLAHKEVLGAVAATMAFGAIGLIDDILSIVHNHNYGLPGWLKFALQVVAGTCFSFWWDSLNLSSPYKMKSLVPLPAPVGPLYLGKWYLPLTVFCFVAMANGINLTDGLDGLAGGTAALTFIGMSIAVMPIYTGLSVFGASMAGACIGFLMHNRYKASIFMGDTGSLALGGALAAMAVCSGMFLPLFIASGVFVAETVSVMMQVFYFKVTKWLHGAGSRVFRMAPLHHHFELSGVKEPQIIGSAYCITFVLSLLAAYMGLISA